MKVKIYFVASETKNFDFFLDQKVKSFFEERKNTENESFLDYVFDKEGTMVVLSQVGENFDENDLQNQGARTMKLVKKIAKAKELEKVKIEIDVNSLFCHARECKGLENGNRFFANTQNDGVSSGTNVKDPVKTQEGQGKQLFFLEKGLLLGRQNDDIFKEEASKLVIQDEDIVGLQNEELFPIVQGIEFARSLTFQPANIINADSIQKFCEDELKKRGITIKVYEKKDLEKENMNLFLAVGRASSIPPKMLVLEYSPDGKEIASDDEVFAFVGKGVTYDSGGIYLKPYPHMNEMHGDMGGAASVIGIMSGLQALNVQEKVLGVIGLVENMPDTHAYKNGEILKSKSGKTVYVSHSDAEGRLVLADMMTFVEEKYNTNSIVSIATLTGAVMRALGEMYTGVIGKNKDLLKNIKKYGKMTNERVWELPLDKILIKGLEHPLADVDNIGKYQTLCGAQLGAGFVSRFLKDSSKWVHCDIAGSCLRNEMRQDYDLDKGLGTGALIHLFLELLKKDSI